MGSWVGAPSDDGRESLTVIEVDEGDEEAEHPDGVIAVGKYLCWRKREWWTQERRVGRRRGGSGGHWGGLAREQ